jgi:hypothetical protein
MLTLIRLAGAAVAVGAAFPLVLTPVVDRRRRAALRRLVPAVCAILDAHGIGYWADFGTLLGFRREADIIVSDKDADLSVLADERPRIMALAPQFARAGLTLTDCGGRSRRVLRIQDGPTLYHLDIYTYRRDGDVLRSELHSPNEDIPAHLVAQRVPAAFLGGSIQVPVDVDKVLLHRYGNGYLTPRRGDKGATRPYRRLRAVMEDIEAGWIGIWSWLRSMTA